MTDPFIKKKIKAVPNNSTEVRKYCHITEYTFSVALKDTCIGISVKEFSKNCSKILLKIRLDSKGCHVTLMCLSKFLPTVCKGLYGADVIGFSAPNKSIGEWKHVAA